jgi:5-methyltetrahydropteroyltriglutamate--homocysteine methyltransferase
VPSVAEVTELIEKALGGVPERQLWINPDCGLKTRGYEETLASLRNIIEATRIVREKQST